MKVEWLERELMVGPYLALVTNEKQFHRAMRDCKVPAKDYGPWILTDHADATMHTLEKPDGKMCCIVAIRAKKDQDPNEIVGLLVHESVHIWQKFKERIGERDPSTEFEAYAIQTISQRLISAYSRLTAKRVAKPKK